MDEKNDDDKKQDDHVMFSSAWVGNIAMIAMVLLMIAAAVAYKELF
jgi:hypothetical protein